MLTGASVPLHARVREAVLARRSPWTVVLVVSCVAYVLVRFLTHEPGVYSLGDTARYESVRGLPLLSMRFLAGDRAPVVPLLWKLLHVYRAAVIGQWALSVIAWVALAVAIATTARRTWLRTAALWLVLGLSLGSSVTQWDNDLMSESVALSLCALLFAGVILTVRRPTGLRLGLTLLVGLAWVLTRDTDAYGGITVVSALATTAFLRPNRRRLTLIASLGVIAICAIGVADAAYAHRDDEPARDAIWIRLRHEDPAALTWMKAHGYRGLWAANTVSVYKSFLLHHPLWTLLDPLRDRPSDATFSSDNRLSALYTPNVSGYDGGGARLRMPAAVEGLFWPKRPLLLGIELLASVLVFGLGAVRGVMKGRWAIAAVAGVALLGVYPQLLVAWHFSGQEVDRHALIAAAQLRIAVLLILVLGIDALDARFRVGRRPIESD